MRSIEKRFKKIEKDNEFLGSCSVLARAVEGQNFEQSAITRAFSKLVPKNEYLRKERRGIIKFLTNLSNPLEDDTIMKKNDL